MTRRPARVPFFTLFIQYWLPVLAYITLIIALSSRPNLRPPVEFMLSDKFYHLAEYLVLGMLLGRAVRTTFRIGRPAIAGLIAIAIGVVVGTSDEYYQSFIPGRESSGWDLLADTVGLVISQLLMFMLRRN